MMSNLKQQPSHTSPSIFIADGRLGRLSYAAWTFLILFLVTLGGGIIYGICLFVFGVDPTTSQLDLSNITIITGLILTILLVLLLIYMNFVLAIKRLHDLDKVGWICLLNFVPGVSFFFTFYLMYAKGTTGENNYGAPKPTKIWEKIIGWPMLLMPIIFVLAIIGAIIYSNSISNTVTKISEQTTYIEHKIASDPVASAVKPH